jgi:Glycosyltransferase
MKVLHVTPSVARADGGPSEVIRGLIPALHERGMDAHVLTTNKGLSERDTDISEAHWLRHVPSVGSASLTYAPALPALLRKLINDYDVVHIHGFQSFPGTVAMRIARRAGVPYLIEPHGALDDYHWRQNVVRKRIWRLLLDGRNIQHLGGAVYSSGLEVEQARAVLPHTPAFPMPLAVDESLFTLDRDPTPSRPVQIAYLGRITQKKRVDLLVRALAETPLAERDVRLVIAGGSDGTIESPDSLAHALGVQDRVTVLGPVGADQRRRLLKECALFALPSEDESFGMAVAEAMAAGMAVVTSNRVGIAPAAEKQGALLIAENDPRSIAATIRAAIEDPHLGERARAYAGTHFRWSEAAAHAERAYEAVTTGNAV